MASGNIVATKTKKGKVVEYTVYPTGDRTLDKTNFEFAVKNVEPSGAVVLKSHPKNEAGVTTFNFGGDTSTIYLLKDANEGRTCMSA